MNKFYRVSEIFLTYKNILFVWVQEHIFYFDSEQGIVAGTAQQKSNFKIGQAVVKQSSLQIRSMLLTNCCQAKRAQDENLI